MASVCNRPETLAVGELCARSPHILLSKEIQKPVGYIRVTLVVPITCNAVSNYRKHDPIPLLPSGSTWFAKRAISWRTANSIICENDAPEHRDCPISSRRCGCAAAGRIKATREVHCWIEGQAAWRGQLSCVGCVQIGPTMPSSPLQQSEHDLRDHVHAIGTRIHRTPRVIPTARPQGRNRA